MTDKEKRELKDGVISIFKNFNLLDHTATIGGLRDDILRYIDSLQEEPVNEDLEKAAEEYAHDITMIDGEIRDYGIDNDQKAAFKAGAKLQETHLWKSADGDDLPEIDREVVVLVQDYPDDKDHLRVAFAHKPNKYAKVWNPDLGEEQIMEIERHGKGEWNIPDVRYWLDVGLPKEIEL